MQYREGWTSDFNLPSSVWLPGFFNPQSFLTAIMQSTARKNELPLDKMCLVCEVTKKNKEEVTMPPKEGAFVHGLYMEVTQTINFMPSLKPTLLCRAPGGILRSTQSPTVG